MAVSLEQSLQEVAALLSLPEVSHVTIEENGHPIGVITDKDLLRLCAERSLEGLVVREVIDSLPSRNPRDNAPLCENLFRSIVESQTDFILRSLPDTTIIFANSALCQALGVSLPEVLGKKWLDFTDPLEMSPTLKRLAELTPTQDSFITENRDYRDYGEEGWTQWINRGIFDDQGNLLEILSVGRDISAFKAMESTKHWLNHILDKMQVGVMIQDKNAKILLLNAKAYELLGLSLDQMLGRAPLDLAWNVIHEDGSPFPSHLHPMAEAMRLLQPITQVVMGVNLPGAHDRVWLLVDAYPVLDPAGKLVQVIGCFTDITLRKQAEFALQASEQRFRLVADAAPVLISVADRQGEGTFFNRGWQEFTGRDPAALLADGWIADIYPEDLPPYLACYQAAIATQQVCEMEYRLKHHDGTYHWIFDRRVPMLQSDGTILGFIGAGVDIHERKQALYLLHKQSQRIRTLLDTSFDGVVVISENQVVEANIRFAEMLGYSPTELLTLSVNDWEVPGDGETPGSISQGLGIGKPHRIFETRHRRKDGSCYAVEVSSSEVEIEEKIYHIWICRDISDRKKAEQQLIHSEGRLRHILSAASDGIALVDRNYIYQVVNPVYLRLRDKTMEEMIGSSMEEIKGEKQFLHIVKPYFDRCLLGEVVQFSQWYDLPALGHRFLTVTYSPCKENTAEVLGVVITFTDLTAQKLSQQALEKQKERELIVNVIAQRVAISLDLNDILYTTVEEVRHFLSVDRVVIYQFEADSTGVVIMESIAEGYPSILGLRHQDICFLQDTLASEILFSATEDVYQSNFSPCYLEFLTDLNIRAKLVVPLWLKDRLWGLLIAHHSTPHPWSDQDTGLLAQLSTQVSLALDKSLMHREILRQIQKEKLLNRIICNIRDSLKLEVIFNTAADEIAHFLGARQVTISQYIASDDHWIHLHGYCIEGAVPNTQEGVISVDNSPFSTQLKQLQPILVEHVDTCPDQPDRVITQQSAVCWMVIPIVVGNKLWGSLTLKQNQPPSSWQAEDIKFATAIADQLGVAIRQAHEIESRKVAEDALRSLNQELESIIADRTQLLQASQNILRQQYEREIILTRITSRIRESLELSQILQRTVVEVQQVLQSDRILIYTLNPDGSGTVSAESVNPGWNRLLGSSFPAEVFPPETVANYSRGKTGIICSLQQADASECFLEFIRNLQVKSLVCVAVLQKDQVWGLLIAHQCSRERTWSAWEVNLLEQLTVPLGIAIKQAKLYDQVQGELSVRKRYELELQNQWAADRLLAQISASINQSLFLEDILNNCLDQIRLFLKTDRVIIYRFNGDSGDTIEKESISDPRLSISNVVLDDPCFKTPEQMLKYTSSHYYSAIGDTATTKLNECHRGMLLAFDVKANLVVSIIAAGSVWGLLIAHDCTNPRNWTALEVDVFQQIATQVGTAVQKQYYYALMEQELTERNRIAYALQKKLEQEELFSLLSQKIRWSFDLKDILGSSAMELRKILLADRVAIVKNNFYPPNTIVANSHQIPEETTLALPQLDQFDYASYIDGYTMDSHNIMAAIVLFDDLSEDQATQQNFWGVIIIQSCTPRVWSLQEITLIKQMANQLGIAVQKSNLYTQIKSELAQKEVLLKEIHHRVKNNLQVMSSLLRLQFQDAAPELSAMIEEYQHRIITMALVHEQLYRSDDLKHIDLHTFFTHLVQGLCQTYGRGSSTIQILINTHHISLSLDQAVPIGLMLNELVSNALKYAFPQRSGTISIQLDRRDHQLHFVVEDDGVGIPLNIDVFNTKSLGMQLILDFSDQLGGEVIVTRQQGTKFEIVFPFCEKAA